MSTAEPLPPASLLERTPDEWGELLASWDEPRYRALQVFRWIHQRGVADPEQMSDLPKSLRARLAQEGLRPALEVARVHASSDGTHKLLLRLNDDRQIESVLIPRGSPAAEGPYEPDQDAESNETPEPGALPPVTQCVSAQVGCAMGCVFCASGIAGLKRHLSAGEIVGQALAGRAQLAGKGRLAGVVLMGMGEPLQNYAAVARALRLISHKEGIGMSLRRITLSTSGLVDEIDQLGRDFRGQVALAISLHAANDDTRSAIMPINRRHPLGELLPALRRYPLPPRRLMTVEYTLLAGINDSPADARELALRLRGLRAKVNLIPMNPVDGTNLRAPEPAVVDAFQRVLEQNGLSVFVRRRRGDDIAAACGQLALLGERAKVRNPFRLQD
jgi:23S rRNA (adenine2503-C2)-methyltransferase